MEGMPRSDPAVAGLLRRGVVRGNLVEDEPQTGCAIDSACCVLSTEWVVDASADGPVAAIVCGRN
jgi:hypothetical protein